MKRIPRLACWLTMLTLFVPSASRAQLVFTAGNASVHVGNSGSVDLTLTNNGPDRSLGDWAASVILANNPTHDVKLNDALPGTDGQFAHFTNVPGPFNIAMGQTITLKSLGFIVPFGTPQDIVGIHLSDLVGFFPLTFDTEVGTGVDGSITVLGPALFEVPNLALHIAMGQTITLATLGFSVAPGAGPNVVGVNLSDGHFVLPLGQDVRDIPVMNGSITVLGQSSVREPGAPGAPGRSCRSFSVVSQTPPIGKRTANSY